jgi:hypothetical protein
MSAKNSISQLLEQFLELNTNSLEIFNRINEAISTDKETVTIDLYDPSKDGVKSVQIPAFGYLKRELERLEANISSISDVEDKGSTVRLKDGTYRKLFTSKLKGPSKPITNLAAPTQFNTKLNEFFEDFLNPLLTIKLDVSGQIPVETERIYVERYIFDGDDAITLDQFEESYKGSNELTKAGLESDIAENNLKYYIDSEVIEMPIRSIQYSGLFNVTKITNEQKSQVIDGVTQNKTVKLFTLDKLSYSDSSKRLEETEVLKVGDSLVVNSGELKTRYIIKAIDNSTSQVELRLIEGFEPIKTGANVLSVYRDIDTDLDIEINVGFDERQVIFLKPIDPISNIPSNNYSPGVSFYSNELKINAEDGTVKTLASYYKDEVSDFGQFIKALKVDYIPPASLGIVPATPELQLENLKVVQVNTHLTDNTTTQKIKELKADKLSAEQALKNLDEAIKQKKTLLNTKKFKSQVERDKQTNEYSSLVSQRESEAKLFASIVSEIKSSAESSNLSSTTPKFRVRGFWPIPSPRIVGDQLAQEVVQFKIRYRYVSASGKTSQVDQLQFTDETNQSTKTAAFSNWIEVDGPVRKRELGSDGKYAWITESEEDAQAVNFNSLDLPINSGEIMEIMVKSLSEAGYPANPIGSEWSSIIKIEFPEGELATDSLSDLVNSNELDSLKVSINEDLETKGVFNHISDGYTINERYYAHGANSLASGFLTQEQSPISVYDKLLELSNEIKSLKAQINGTIGELIVTLTDEEGNVMPITKNETLKVFAGYYVNELPSSKYKGHIVTKNFKIKLENSKATDLELIARILGDTEMPVYSSTDSKIFGLRTGSVDSKVSNNSYYTDEGMYDLVPVVYQNLEANDLAYNYFNENPNQSSQLRGQFIYSRFMNLANDKNLYITESNGNASPANGDIDNAIQSGYDRYEYGLGAAYNISSTPIIDNNNFYKGEQFISSNGWTPAAASTNVQEEFIWRGTVPTSGNPIELLQGIPTDYDNSIYMHELHPLAQAKELTALEIQSNGLIGIPKTAPLRASDAFGRMQTPFRFIESVNNDNTAGIRTSGRNSFTPEDKYLLGGHSCGSFLFLSPLSKDSHVVDAKNKRGKKLIPGNSANSIVIDVVFQYRMTDHNGKGEDGNGRVGGVIGNIFTNLTYAKKIGIDILDTNGNDFQFDIEVFAKYKATGKNINAITSAMLSNYNSGGGSFNNPSQYYSGGSLNFANPKLISVE